MEDEVLKMRQRQVFFDRKWGKILKYSWLFRFMPFVDFVLVAGSMALGNIHKDSDFDMIIGARLGRIFTARFFCALIFGILGLRRAKFSHRESAADKFCFNHFVTIRAFKLSPPYHPYWQALYQNLVPIYGPLGLIREFWEANRIWMIKIPDYYDDLRHRYRSSSAFKKILEAALAGFTGNAIEKFLKRLQIQRIKHSLVTDPPGYQPRLRFSDEELEFHPDTKRIESFK